MLVPMSKQNTELAPVILIHSLDQAVAALRAAAALGCPLVLASEAAAFGGVAWFQALIDQARDAVPAAHSKGLLDCADQPGLALEALRQGCPLVRFQGRRKTAIKLADIAEQSGSRLITGPIDSLDLLGEADPEAACRRWLEGHGGP